MIFDKMGFEIPTIKKCFYFFPRRPGLLVCGYIKVIVCIILEAINIALLLRFKSDIITVLIGVQVTSLIIDCGSVIVFIIGCHKNNLLCISWYYTYSLYMLMLKTLFMIVLCFLEPYLLLTLIAGTVFSGYMLLLIRSEYLDTKKISEAPCEFVNQLASPGCNIKIEVVDDGIPEKERPNNLYIVNGTEVNHINGEVEGKTVANSDKKPTETIFE